MRRFPPPWTIEQIPGGFKVIDANGQSLAYVYSRDTDSDALIANVLTTDEARRIAATSPSCPNYWGRCGLTIISKPWVISRMSVMRPKTRRPRASHRAERWWKRQAGCRLI